MKAAVEDETPGHRRHGGENAQAQKCQHRQDRCTTLLGLEQSHRAPLKPFTDTTCRRVRHAPFVIQTLDVLTPGTPPRLRTRKRGRVRLASELIWLLERRIDTAGMRLVRQRTRIDDLTLTEEEHL